MSNRHMIELRLPQSYLLFLGDVTEAPKESARLNLPVADPIRGGFEFDALVEACLMS